MLKKILILCIICKFGYVVGQHKMIFNTYSKIFEVSTDGTSYKSLISGNEIIDIVDSQSKIFFSDKANSGIYEVDKGSKKTQRLAIEGYTPKGIWYVEESNDLYFTDNVKKAIYKYNFNDKSITEVLSNINDAWEICVNVKDNLIIWSEFISENIMICDLQGNNRKLVKSGVFSLFQIEYNSQTKEIFYFQNGNASTNSGIRKINIDGTGFKQLVTNLSKGFSADFINNKLYMIVSFGELNSYDLNGLKIETIGNYDNVNSCYYSPYDAIVYYKSDNKEAAITEIDLTTKIANVFKLNDVFGASGAVYDSLTQDIYYINSGEGLNNVLAGSIFKYNLETKNTTVILKNETVLGYPTDIDIDFEAKLIFWVDSRHRTVFTCNLDGSNPQKLFNGSLFEGNTVQLDKKLKRVHIFDSSTNEIFEYDYTGKKTYSYDIPSWNRPTDMVFDADSKKYYICEETSKKIRTLSRTSNVVSDLITHTSSIYVMEIVDSTLFFVDQNSIMFSLNLKNITDPPKKIADIKTYQSFNIYSLAKINFYNKVNNGVSSTLNNNKVNFEIYPNPSNGFFNLTSDYEIINIEIGSLDGKFADLKHQINQNMIDLSHYSNGVYILNIKLINGEHISRKIVILK